MRLDRYSIETALVALDRSLSAIYSLEVIQVIIKCFLTMIGKLTGFSKDIRSYLTRLGFDLGHRIFYCVRGSVAQFDRFILDLGAGPFTGLRRKQQRRTCTDQAAKQQPP